MSNTKKSSSGIRIDSFGVKALSQLSEVLAPRAVAIDVPVLRKISPASPAARFTKVSAAGALLAPGAKEWEGVFDATTGLVWGRKLLPGAFTHAEAMKAVASAKLCGKTARASTANERMTIVDFSRVEPALDIDFFEPSERDGYEWTSTVSASSPADVAWGVNLGGGDCFRLLQSDRGGVRAVLAGQFLGF